MEKCFYNGVQLPPFPGTLEYLSSKLMNEEDRHPACPYLMITPDGIEDVSKSLRRFIE